MFAKLLLTLAVIVAAYSAVRARFKRAQPSSCDPQSSPFWPWLRAGAYGLIGLILLTSAWSLIHQWQRAREVIDIQVVNPATGAVDHYRARRGEIQGRGFRTLDGQQVRIAEFERMILNELR